MPKPRCRTERWRILHAGRAALRAIGVTRAPALPHRLAGPATRPREARSRESPGGGSDDGEAVRHRFGKGHPVTLVKGRQHEEVSRPIGAHHHSRRLLAGKSNAPTEARGGYHLPYQSRSPRVAVERADTQHVPVEVAHARQSRNEDLMAFTRDHARNTKQRANRAAPRPQRPARLGRDARDYEDAVVRDAISLDRRRRSRTGTKDAATAVPRGTLEPNEARYRRVGT